MAYLDDVVILAENKVGMKWIMRETERDFEEGKQSINIEKSKIVIFKEGRSRKI